MCFLINFRLDDFSIKVLSFSLFKKLPAVEKCIFLAPEYFLIWSVKVSVGDVVLDRVVKQNRVLNDENLAFEE